MEFRNCKDVYVVRLAIGEEVVSSLTAFVRQKRIKSGWLQGIGAVNQAVLGVYDLARRQYEKRTFPMDLELVNLTGNIAWLGSEPVLHIHALVADSKLRSYGGHLFQARVAVTVEVVVVPLKTRLKRALDPETGLNLLALGRRYRAQG